MQITSTTGPKIAPIIKSNSSFLSLCQIYTLSCNNLMMDKNNAVLVLKDGTVVRGRGFGAKTQAEGELVFNTSMGGYQE